MLHVLLTKAPFAYKTWLHFSQCPHPHPTSEHFLANCYSEIVYVGNSPLVTEIQQGNMESITWWMYLG